MALYLAMSKSNTNAFRSLSLPSKLATLFRSQLDLLEEVLEKPLSESSQHVMPLLCAIRGTGKATLLLEREGLLNELALIQRVLVQRIINCCYLMNAEQHVIENYLARPMAAAKSSFQGKGVDALVDFSRNYTPEEVASPFTLNLKEQVEEIAQKTGVTKELFLLPMLWVFPKSSEILSGSLYGAVFQFEHLIPSTTDVDDSGDSLSKHSEELCAVFFQGIRLFGALFEIIAKHVPVESIKKKSTENSKIAEQMIQEAIDRTLVDLTPADGTWERLDCLEAKATSAISKQLQGFALPFQEAYEAGALVPTLKPMSQPSVDLRCAALLLKRSLNDFRAVWLLLSKGYTSQAASVAASLYECALATVCLTLSEKNVQQYMSNPKGEIPWSPMAMAKIVVRGTATNPITGKEFENNWRALYAHYVWLCQIKHSAHDSVLHDTSASNFDGKGYAVIAIPNTEAEDAVVKASIAIKSLLRLLECVAAFARALGYKDKRPSEGRFAERLDYAFDAGWKAYQQFQKPSPISISRSWFVRKYPPVK